MPVTNDRSVCNTAFTPPTGFMQDGESPWKKPAIVIGKVALYILGTIATIALCKVVITASLPYTIPAASDKIITLIPKMMVMLAMGGWIFGSFVNFLGPLIAIDHQPDIDDKDPLFYDLFRNTTNNLRDCKRYVAQTVAWPVAGAALFGLFPITIPTGTLLVLGLDFLDVINCAPHKTLSTKPYTPRRLY